MQQIEFPKLFAIYKIIRQGIFFISLYHSSDTVLGIAVHTIDIYFLSYT